MWGKCKFLPRTSRTSCLALVHLHASGCLPLQSPWLLRARGGEETTILSSSLFLVGNWSGVCQSPRTGPWSSFQSRQVGQRSTCWGQRGWWEPSLANELQQAVSNKISSQPALPLVFHGFHWTHRELTPGWEHPSTPELHLIKREQKESKVIWFFYL